LFARPNEFQHKHFGEKYFTDFQVSTPTETRARPDKSVDISNELKFKYSKQNCYWLLTVFMKSSSLVWMIFKGGGGDKQEWLNDNVVDSLHFFSNKYFIVYRILTVTTSKFLSEAKPCLGSSSCPPALEGVALFFLT